MPVYITSLYYIVLPNFMNTLSASRFHELHAFACFIFYDTRPYFLFFLLYLVVAIPVVLKTQPRLLDVLRTLSIKSPWCTSPFRLGSLPARLQVGQAVCLRKIPDTRSPGFNDHSSDRAEQYMQTCTKLSLTLQWASPESQDDSWIRMKARVHVGYACHTVVWTDDVRHED